MKQLIKRLIAIHVILGVLAFWLFVSTTPVNAQMAFQGEAEEVTLVKYIAFICDNRVWRLTIILSNMKKLSVNLAPEQTQLDLIDSLRHFDYDTWVLVKDQIPMGVSSCGVFE